METMRRIALLAAGFLALLGLIVALDIALLELMPGDAVEEMDRDITQWLVEARTPGLSSFMRSATTLGSARLIWFVAGIAAVAAYLSARTGGLLPLLPLVAMLGGLMNSLGKALTDRPRPLIRPLVETGSSSFPSGHATIAALIFSALAVLIARGLSRRGKAAVWAAASAPIALVAVTRVYLGVHWPSDVVVGAATGIAWSLWCGRTLASNGAKRPIAGEPRSRVSRYPAP
ncbi:MAG: phosphatase PAP2 family protein [Actinomycetota bacterium]